MRHTDSHADHHSPLYNWERDVVHRMRAKDQRWSERRNRLLFGCVWLLWSGIDHPIPAVTFVCVDDDVDVGIDCNLGTDVSVEFCVAVGAYGCCLLLILLLVFAVDERPTS